MKSKPNRLMWVGGLGAGFAALCCFTPIAVIALGAVGAGAAVAYLDSILFPALFICAALFVGAWIWGRNREAACAKVSGPGPVADHSGVHHD